MQKYELVVGDNINCRLDKYVADHIDNCTRAKAQILISQSLITVNDKVLTKSYSVKAGDKVSVIINDPEEVEIIPEDIPLDIIYEDNDILVVNKQKGMVVHPAPGNPNGTLVNALIFHCKGGLSGINGEIRPGIVHRIDKDTSGLLVVAKSDMAHNFLAEEIKEHNVKRVYYCVCYGKFKDSKGTINAPIGRDPKDRKKMTVTLKNSKPAVSHYEVLEEYEGFSLVKVKLETGRTHQIRVHMAYIGHAVAGDSVYGPRKCITELNGQCLHAKEIEFIHPVTRKLLQFETELPCYFKCFINKLSGGKQ
jgi:23S rRNA pseudouridine1911/1915/1917 synthase